MVALFGRLVEWTVCLDLLWAVSCREFEFGCWVWLAADLIVVVYKLTCFINKRLSLNEFSLIAACDFFLVDIWVVCIWVVDNWISCHCWKAAFELPSESLAGASWFARSLLVNLFLLVICLFELRFDLVVIYVRCSLASWVLTFVCHWKWLLLLFLLLADWFANQCLRWVREKLCVFASRLLKSKWCVLFKENRNRKRKNLLFDVFAPSKVRWMNWKRSSLRMKPNFASWNLLNLNSELS